MVSIPLESFRILKKKFGWKESFGEIVNDDNEDVNNFISNIENNQKRFVDPETEEIGEWDGSTLDITRIWLQYFIFMMRSNVKISYLLVGVETRGIPKKIAEEHILEANEMKERLENLFFKDTFFHFFFLFAHLYDQESHRGKQEFFDLLFENHYLTCVKTAYEIALEHPMHSKQTVDINQLERKLRAQWMGYFKKQWSLENPIA